MTQEVNKDLLLKYLCMALPYNMYLKHKNYPKAKLKLICVFNDGRIGVEENCIQLTPTSIDECKPYLRLMSNMTEEEAKEIASVCLLDSRDILSIKITDEYLDVTIDDGFSSTETITLWYDELISSIESLYYLLEHHFDFMGLIPKSLAIEVTKENNPYKN